MLRRVWSQEEDQMLVDIVMQMGENDWSNVASLLHTHLPTLIIARTGKQCRQRWYNQLRPSVNKQKWTSEEESRLIEVQRIYRNRWKEMTIFFENRTDNDIKNKFYSTMRRSFRRLNKILGQKNSTGEIRQIKPSVLSSIVNYLYQQTEVKYHKIPTLIFQFSSLKPTKTHEQIDTQMRESITIILSLLEKFKANPNKQICSTHSTVFSPIITIPPPSYANEESSVAFQ